MKIIKNKHKLTTELSLAEISVRRSLNRLKSDSIIQNFSITFLDKDPDFTIICSVIMDNTRSFFIELEYRYDRRSSLLRNLNRARHVIFPVGGSFLRYDRIFNFFYRKIKERKKGYDNEDRVEKEFLPKIKSEGIILSFKKTKSWIDKSGLDFEIKVPSASKKPKKIFFELKSSVYHQKKHAKRYPKKSSIAVHPETSYEEFKIFVLILIDTVRSGKRAVLYDKRCA